MALQFFLQLAFTISHCEKTKYLSTPTR